MIKVCEPNLDLKDAAAVVEAIRNTWISGYAPCVAEFEQKFAAYIGTSFAVSCNSGASALHLALDALGIKKGDEVIVPDLTMIATANAVSYLGAKPVFVDSEFETWCIDPARIEEKITKRTKAIVPVHLYGHPVKMDEIEEFDIPIVEDAAEAIGSEYKGKKCGCLGIESCFSFYANKNITTGCGGMVTTNDLNLAEIARALRSHAFGKREDVFQHFSHTRLGYSYRLSGLQAALGCSQMDRVEELVAHKVSNGKFYNEFLRGLAEEGKIVLPPQATWAKNTFWYYTILLNLSFGMTRDELMKNLWADGIETRTTFIPMHRQPIYSQGVTELSGKSDFPVSDMIAETGINLPSSSRLKPEEIMYICESIKKHVR